MNEPETEPDWELPTSDEKDEISKKVVVASVLSALSIAFTPIAEYVPRAPWGIAFFDPVSVIWIIAFLIGGLWVGLVCLVVGGLALNFFDPFAPVGPIIKMVATLPMILIPWIGVKIASYRNRDRTGKKATPEESDSDKMGGTLSNPLLFSVLMLLALVIRLLLTIPLNLAVVPALYGIDDPAIIISFTVTINITTAFTDALLPYIIVYPTSVYKNFKLW